MKKLFPRCIALAALVIVSISAPAQIIWPTADTVSIRASQFADATTIRAVRRDTALSASLATFKGWIAVSFNQTSGTATVPSEKALWQWTADGTGKTGAYWGTRSPINSADVSRGAGAAIFNSDYLDGTLSITSPHKGELWSPIMDATGLKDLSVTFSSDYRHYLSSDSIACHASTAIAWSEDGGVTLKPYYCLFENDGYGTNENGPNQPIAIKLLGSKGTNKFRIKFIWDGDYYFWIVDDVKVGALKYNMRVSPEWVALPQTAVQRSNVDTVRFLADVVNNGNVAATNVKLTVDVFDNTSKAKVYSATRNYGTIAADSIAENGLIAGGFVANALPASYDVRYSITHDSSAKDAFPTDDTLRYNAVYNVTDSLMQRDRGTFVNGYAPDASTWTGTQKRAWKVGCYYYFPRGTNSTASRISAYLGDFSLITAARSYTATLYEWNDLNKNDSVEVNERTLIAGGTATVAANPTADVLLDFKLENAINNQPLKLKDKQAYLAMLEIDPTVSGTSWYAGFNDQRRYTYGAEELATYKAGQPRYTGVINYNANDLTEKWSTYVFDRYGALPGEYIPKVRLWAWPVVRVDTKDNLDDNYKVAIYPNPVQETLQLDVDFPTTQEAVMFRVFDVKGELLREKEVVNIQKEKVNINVADLPNGTYILQALTLGNKVRAMRFVVAK